jgi:hypothetical protein
MNTLPNGILWMIFENLGRHELRPLLILGSVNRTMRQFVIEYLSRGASSSSTSAAALVRCYRCRELLSPLTRCGPKWKVHVFICSCTGCKLSPMRLLACDWHIFFTEECPRCKETSCAICGSHCGECGVWNFDFDIVQGMCSECTDNFYFKFR